MRYCGEVYLNLLPVCECGEILRDAYLCECIDKIKDGYNYKTIDIKPACCPFCGQTIGGFKIMNEYLDMFKG